MLDGLEGVVKLAAAADMDLAQSIVHLSKYLDGAIEDLDSHHALVYGSVLIDLIVTGKLPQSG